MKQLLLLAFVSLLNVPLAFGQCVPDTTINSILVPPSGSQFDTVNGRPIVILPYAHVNQNYSEVLQFKVPKDTSYMTLNGTVDSVELVEVINLPSSLSMSCTPSNCVFPGGTYGCGQLSGTPVTPDSIELRVAVVYTVDLGTGGTPLRDTLDGYFLVVKGGPISIAETEIKKFSPRVFPNPADKRISIEINGLTDKNVKLQITNVIGSLVYETSFVPGKEPHQVDISHLQPGVYLYSLRSAEKSFTGRFSVSR